MNRHRFLEQLLSPADAAPAPAAAVLSPAAWAVVGPTAGPWQGQQWLYQQALAQALAAQKPTRVPVELLGSPN